MRVEFNIFSIVVVMVHTYIWQISHAFNNDGLKLIIWTSPISQNISSQKVRYFLTRFYSFSALQVMAHRHSFRSHENAQQLKMFSANIKKDMDTFWNNILGEFNSFSAEITNRLEQLAAEHEENNKKYGSSNDKHHVTEQKEQYRKFPKGNDNISIRHSHSFIRKDIQTAFKLDPFSHSIYW